MSFLDSDDLWLPDYLEVMGSALDSEPDAAIAYGDAWMIDDATRRIARWTAMAPNDPPIPPPRDPLEFLARLLLGNFIFVSTTVRRSVLDDVGGFDATLPCVEDFDLWIRIAAAGWRAVRPLGTYVIHRKRPGSLSTNRQLMLKESIRIYQKVAADVLLPSEIRGLADRRANDVAALLESRRGIHGKIAATRGRIGDMKAKLLWRRYWYSTPPDEVSRAFPDLGRV